MSDDRASGLTRNIINFQRNDNSSNTADIPNRKNSKEYYARLEKEEKEEEKPRESEYVDRSAQLKATLMSLAKINQVSVVKTKWRKKVEPDKQKQDEEDK
ncbi:MAG: hypothetical protein MZU97_01890 [Bacillus subtilis]|nr:hypothetical protein [Bacillus subtilis]